MNDIVRESYEDVLKQYETISTWLPKKVESLINFISDDDEEEPMSRFLAAKQILENLEFYFDQLDPYGGSNWKALEKKKAQFPEWLPELELLKKMREQIRNLAISYLNSIINPAQNSESENETKTEPEAEQNSEIEAETEVEAEAETETAQNTSQDDQNALFQYPLTDRAG